MPIRSAVYVHDPPTTRRSGASEEYRNRPVVITGRNQVFQTLKQLVELMRVNHVKVMVGTDLADGRIFPWYSVHEEIALLVTPDSYQTRRTRHARCGQMPLGSSHTQRDVSANWRLRRKCRARFNVKEIGPSRHIER